MNKPVSEIMILQTAGPTSARADYLFEVLRGAQRVAAERKRLRPTPYSTFPTFMRALCRAVNAGHVCLVYAHASHPLGEFALRFKRTPAGHGRLKDLVREQIRKEKGMNNAVRRQPKR